VVSPQIRMLLLPFLLMQPPIAHPITWPMARQPSCVTISSFCLVLPRRARASQAWREEAGEVAGKNLDLWLCSNRACEVGMERATHAPNGSFSRLCKN
jgi:hypothetical protein